MTSLEIRMFNILRRNPIIKSHTSGKYKAALTRLANQGLAVQTQSEFRLSTRFRVRCS